MFYLAQKENLTQNNAIICICQQKIMPDDDITSKIMNFWDKN